MTVHTSDWPCRSVLRGALVAGVASLSLAACATAPHPIGFDPAGAQGRKIGKPYQVRGVWYTPSEQPNYDEVGMGSWYGEQFHNRQTANGELFDMDIPSAAHKTLPLPSLVEVTNLANGRKIVVRVNDRGPFIDGRIIDLSKAAASQLDYQRAGVTRVRVRYLGPAPLRATEPRLYRASLPERPSPEPSAAPVAMAAAPPPRLAYEPITVAAIAPIRPVYKPIDVAAMTPAAPPAYRPAASGYRVQAGAFSNRANAERAAAGLSDAGHVEVVQTGGGGAPLYRVMLSGAQATSGQ